MEDRPAAEDEALTSPEVPAATLALYPDVDSTDSEPEAGPEQPVAEVTPELLSNIIKQVEFYFSDSNLPTDKKLLKQIRKDPQGFVPVKLFANFRKIRALTKDPEVIAMALSESQGLMLSSDMRCVRRITPVPEYNINDLQRRIVVIEHLPIGNTIETVSEMFSEYGRIKVVRICSRDSRGKLPGWMTAVCAFSTSQQHAFVEYWEEHEAIKAAAVVYPEGDSRQVLKVARLCTLAATLPPALQQQHGTPSSSWRDEPLLSTRRSRGGAGGSSRPSREASPMGVRIARQSHGTPSKSSAGRTSGGGDRSQSSDVHGHRSGGGGGSAGGADNSAVWGHEGFQQRDSGRTQRRMSSQESGAPRSPHAFASQDARSQGGWQPDSPAHGNSPRVGSNGGVSGTKTGAYTPPGRRTLDSEFASAVPLAMRSSYAAAAGGSGACSPMQAPASPRVAGGGGGLSPDAAVAAATSPPASYAAAAAVGTSPDASSHPEGSPPGSRLNPAASGKPPASPQRPNAGAAPSLGSTGVTPGSKAAVDAMIAGVMATGAKQTDKGAAGEGTAPASEAAGLPDSAATATAAAAAAAAAAARRSGGGARAPPASPANADSIDGLISKIITTPMLRCSSGGGADTNSPMAAAAAEATAGGKPTAVGSLISKILSDLPASAGNSPSASPTKPAQQAPVEAGGAGGQGALSGSPWNSVPVAQAAVSDDDEHPSELHSFGPAAAMGRQLSVVPEGNEFERMMSAQFEGFPEAFAFASGHSSSVMDRELSLGMRDETGKLQLTAAAGLQQRAARAANLAAHLESVTLTPHATTSPAAAATTQPVPIARPRPPLAPGSATAAAAERGSPFQPSSSESEGEGDGAGNEAGKARRRRTRRSRRRSAMSPALEGSPGGNGDGDGFDNLPPTIAQQRDGPRQRRASTSSAGGSRRVSDGSGMPGAEGRKDNGAGPEAKSKKPGKKDYASWAAATPEYRAEASGRYGSGASAPFAPGSSPPNARRTASPMASPPRARRPSDSPYGHGDSVAHSVSISRGPDGSRGFAMGRGKPMSPPPRA